MTGHQPVLVLAVGNPSRGDDALGPLLGGRLEDWLSTAGIAGIEVLTDIQLNVEHALDFEDRRRALIVDAAAAGEGPFAFGPLRPARDASYSSHSVSPQAVLQIYRDLKLPHPPQTDLLAVRGFAFELGAPLSGEAEQNLEEAWAFLQSWCLDAAGVCAEAPPTA
jgi:hydrogenase maturation protease